MTCREMTERIPQWVSGELSPAQRTEVEVHLACCADCARYTKTYEETVRLAREAELGAPVPIRLPETLVRDILARRRRPG